MQPITVTLRVAPHKPKRKTLVYKEQVNASTLRQAIMTAIIRVKEYDNSGKIVAPPLAKRHVWSDTLL